MSNNEKLLTKIINGEDCSDHVCHSRMEHLLVELGKKVDAAGGSTGGVTIIDVSTLTERNENDLLYLDLSKNGKYIFYNFPSLDTEVMLKLGYCTNTTIGKFIAYTQGVHFESGEYGINGMEAYAVIYRSTMICVVVDDVCCNFYASGEF